MEAANINMEFSLGWFAHPIFVDGDYPPVMREKIDKKSSLQVIMSLLFSKTD